MNSVDYNLSLSTSARRTTLLPCNQRNIQVLTHCDPARAVRACLLAGSAEVEVICAVNGTLEEIAHRLGNVKIPDNLTLIPAKRITPYPVNLLRNRALAAASAEWVFYIDCDFVFCRHIWDRLFTELNHRTNDRLCFCPVALWDPSGRYLTGTRSQRFLEEETYHTHNAPRVWSEAGYAELFKFHDRYFNKNYGPGTMSYEITAWMMKLRDWIPAEPWGMLKREYMAYADEDFRTGPLDKQQFVTALLNKGLRFFAVPDTFVFHMWHPDRGGAWSDGIRNHCLWAKRHRGRPHHYTLVGAAGTIDSLPKLFIDRLRGKLSAHTEVAYLEWSEMGPNGSWSNVTGVTGGHTSSSGRAIVINGGTHLRPELFLFESKVCLFFCSPLWYRKNGMLSVKSYAEVLCGTPDLNEAVALLDNAAIVCDLERIAITQKLLRNLTGFDVPIIGPVVTTTSMCSDDNDDVLRDRARHSADYLLYDYARGLAGTMAAEHRANCPDNP